MKFRIVEAVAAVLVASVGVVHADPVTPRQITGGQYATNSFNGAFEVAGNGFDLRGQSDIGSGECQPCQGGQSVSFFALSEVRTLSGTVDGVAYPSLFVADSFLGVPSVFNVRSTGSVLIPADGTTGTQITFPFSTGTDGRFIAYIDRNRTIPAFDFPFTGNGTATLTLHLDGMLNGNPVFTGSQITWAFGAAPSATPEPASLVLLGTAVAALAAGRARSRRR
jgi:hypothetical protein